MSLERIIKRVINVLTFIIVAILLTPFILDYLGVDSEEGITKDAFFEETVISKQRSKQIWKKLKKENILRKSGVLNQDVEFDLLIESIDEKSFSKIETQKISEVLKNLQEVSQKKDRQVEILGSSITGYDNSLISWKITADYVYAGKSQYIYNVEDVYSGFIYDENGLIVIDNLKAKKIRINTKRKKLFASENIEVRFLNKTEQQKKLELKGLIAQDNDSNAPVIIRSNELRFNGTKDTVELSKNVEIIQDDVRIYPKKTIYVDNNKNIAKIKDGFKMLATDFSVSGNKMTIFIDEDRSEMEGGLTIFRQEPGFEEDVDEREQNLRRQKTVLTCEKAFYSEKDDKHNIKVMNNIKIVQPDKIIRAEKGIYDEETDFYEITDDVEIDLLSLDWILDKDTSENLENEDVNLTLTQKTTISTDKLTFLGDMKKLTLIGNVKVVQPDKTIRANKLIFDDESLLVYCIGNVSVIKDDKNTIKTKYLVIDLKNETFIAKDGVSSTYHID